MDISDNWIVAVIVVLCLLVLSFGAMAQQPDPKIAAIERQYLEQEMMGHIRDKARIVAASVVDRDTNLALVKKLCELVEEVKRPDECKK